MTGWDLNIGGFIAHYPGWQIRGKVSGFGFEARRRDGSSGRPRGPVLAGRTLDELAARIEAAASPPDADQTVHAAGHTAG